MNSIKVIDNELVDLGTASIETKGIQVGKPEDIGGMQPLAVNIDD